MVKNDDKRKKFKKMTRFNDQGRFFGLFHTYIIHFGGKVHVGTLGPFWVTVGGGAKMAKTGPE